MPRTGRRDIVCHQLPMRAHPHRTPVTATPAPPRTRPTATVIARLVLGQHRPPRADQAHQLGLGQQRPRRHIGLVDQRLQPIKPSVGGIPQCGRQHPVHHSDPNANSARSQVGHGQAAPQILQRPSTRVCRANSRTAVARHRSVSGATTGGGTSTRPAPESADCSSCRTDAGRSVSCASMSIIGTPAPSLTSCYCCVTVCDGRMWPATTGAAVRIADMRATHIRGLREWNREIGVL
jgi:hypothetical protein